MVGHRISFSENLQKLKFKGRFCGRCALKDSLDIFGINFDNNLCFDN